jgi:hypothetical protein
MSKLTLKMTTSCYSIDIEMTSDNDSCDPSEQSEYNWICFEESKNPKIVDDKKIYKKVRSALKKFKIDDDISIIWDYFQKLYYNTQDNDWETLCIAFEDLTGYRLFEVFDSSSESEFDWDCETSESEYY